MSQSSDVHTNGLSINLLGTTTIAGNVTVATPALPLLVGAKYLIVQANFVYGAGGGTTDAYVQTSMDAGVTWLDIMNFHFTTSSLVKVSAVSTVVALAAGVSPGDGALSANTILNGLLGKQIRVKYVTASTVYSGVTTLTVSALVKG
jgi:hypothetical protein